MYIESLILDDTGRNTRPITYKTTGLFTNPSKHGMLISNPEKLIGEWMV